MTCEQAIHLISSRLDGEIQADDRALLERHVAECEECRATADAFELQDRELTETFEPRRQAAALVAERVNAQLPTDAVPRSRPTATPKKHLPMSLFRGAAVVAAAAAVLGPVIVAWALLPAKPTTVADRSHDHGSKLSEQEMLLPRQLPETTPPKLVAIGTVLHTGLGERQRVTLSDGSVAYLNQNTEVRLEAERRLKLDAGEVFVEVSPRAPDQTGATFTVLAPDQTFKAQGTKFDVRADPKGSELVVAQGNVKAEGDREETLVAHGNWWQVLHDANAESKERTPPVVPAERITHVLDWTRDLMTNAETALVPTSRYDGGALIAVDSNGQEAKLSLRKYRIDVHIEDGFARTTIDQTYFNHHPWRLEGTFYFPLPPDASLSRLAMYVDGKLMEGGMAEREYAAQVYQRIVSSQRDPALLEWVDGTTFKMRVFPLEGRQEKRLVLSYTQRLPTLYGRTQYRFPAGHSLQVVNDWAFNAVVKNGAQLNANSPTNPRMKIAPEGADLVLTDAAKAVKVDRDVVLDLTDANKGDDTAHFSCADHDGNSYLMLRYRPALHTTAKPQRRDWIFLYETSADRDPLLARVQIEVIRTLLNNAEHDDTFRILAAGTTIHLFADDAKPATPANVKAAVDFLDHTHLIGALDLGHAFAAASDAAKGTTNPYLVHVGSGITHMGVVQDDLMDHLPQGVRYVGVGIGKSYDRRFMKQAAERTGGYYTQINPDEPITWRAFDLLATLNTPRLLDVRVVDAATDKDEEKWPRFLVDNPSVSQGEEVCAIARLLPGNDRPARVPAALIVTGLLDGQPYREEIKVANVAGHADYLPRTWAKLEIDRLLAANSSDNQPKIVELSKAMYVMTPFTSLLVLENEDMYKEFKVDRGRKDHWAQYSCPDTIPVVYEPDPTQPVDVRNAPKLAKPAANQVLQTVLVRVPARWLDCGNDRSANRGAVVTAVDLYTGAYAMPIGGSNLGRGDEYGVPQLSKVPYIDQLSGRARYTVTKSVVEQRSKHIKLRSLSETTASSEGELTFYREVRPSTDEVIATRGFRDMDGVVALRQSDVALQNLGIFARSNHLRSVSEFGMAPESTGGLKVDIVEVNRAAGRADITPFGRPSVQEDNTGSFILGAGVTSDAEHLGSVVIRGNTRTTQNVVLRHVYPYATDERSLKEAWDQAPQLPYSALDSRVGFQALSDLWAGHARSRTDFQRRGGDYESQTPRSLLYEPIVFSNDQRLFTDLLAYAPGLNTSSADVQAVLEAEAAPELRNAPGHIDPGARQLIDQARMGGWQNFVFDAAKNPAKESFAFDGAGRFVYEQTLPLGLRETVVCDGTTILNEYPELGLAATRPLSRFHRAEWMGAVPWLVPPAEDLAHGADLELVDAQTVALVPHAVKNVKQLEGKTPRYVRVQLVFAGGRLAERQLAEVSEEVKVFAREIYDGQGGIVVRDAEGHELGSVKQPLATVQPPDLHPDTKALVVLPLPFRSRQHIMTAYNLDPNRSLADPENGCYGDLPPDAALQLLGALYAQGAADDARLLVRDCFLAHKDRRAGLFTLLLACGVEAGEDPELFDKLQTEADQPAARYVLLHGNWPYRMVQRRWPLNAAGMIGQPASFLRRLAELQDQTVREPSLTPAWLERTVFDADLKNAADFIHDNEKNVLGWALLTQVQNHRYSRSASLHTQRWAWLAGQWDRVATALGNDRNGRYEQAECLWRAGKPEEARNLFGDIYEQDLQAGLLPAIDHRFRHTLEGDDTHPDAWNKLVRDTAAKFLKKDRRGAVVALATQCQQLGDRPLADNLMSLALADLAKPDDALGAEFAPLKEYQKLAKAEQTEVLADAVRARRLRVTLLAVAYYRRLSDNATAEKLTDGLLADEPFDHISALWRLDSSLADQRGETEKSVRCLEHALDLEFVALPDVIDLQAWRTDYGRLLNHYRTVVNAAAMQHQPPPGDVAARTIRAVDRWRKHDPDAVGACQTASEILKLLGAREIAWEYLTTAEAPRPTTARTWIDLGHRLRNQGDFDTADRAYATAFEADPKNPSILWDRAQDRRQLGDVADCNRLLRQIRDGKWDASYNHIQANARWQLEGR